MLSYTPLPIYTDANRGEMGADPGYKRLASNPILFGWILLRPDGLFLGLLQFSQPYVVRRTAGL